MGALRATEWHVLNTECHQPAAPRPSQVQLHLKPLPAPHHLLPAHRALLIGGHTPLDRSQGALGALRGVAITPSARQPRLVVLSSLCPERERRSWVLANCGMLLRSRRLVRDSHRDPGTSAIAGSASSDCGDQRTGGDRDSQTGTAKGARLVFHDAPACDGRPRAGAGGVPRAGAVLFPMRGSRWASGEVLPELRPATLAAAETGRPRTCPPRRPLRSRLLQSGWPSRPRGYWPPFSAVA